MTYHYYFSLKNNKKSAASAALHVSYLLHTRGRNFESLYISDRLPEWSSISSYNFFKAADTYETKNSIVYNELEFALPCQLSLEQNVALVEDFIAKELPDKYYMMTIHQKRRAVVCYIVFSPRIIDEIEKNKPRIAQDFFSRYNSKNPGRGGARKDTSLQKKNAEKKLRQSLLDCINSHLKKYKLAENLQLSDLASDYTALEDIKILYPPKDLNLPGRLQAELLKLQEKRRELERKISGIKEEEQRLQGELDKLLCSGQMPVDADFESILGLIEQTFYLKNPAHPAPMAYSAEQIKHLLAILSYLLTELIKSGSHTADTVLKQFVKLKKAVNLQIIKDKYYSQKMNVPTICYFVKSNDFYYAKLQKSAIGTQADGVNQAELDSVSIADLHNIKLIAEALSGSKQAQYIVRQLKGNDIAEIDE